VQALPERAALRIEFPRVEGYVVEVRNRLRCDVDAVPELVVDPQDEPVRTLVSPQVGWDAPQVGLNTAIGAPVTLAREEFWAQHRVQRTAFEIARDIVTALAGGRVAEGEQPQAAGRFETARLLFPQALRIVEDYLRRRVRLASPAARLEEVALARYRNVIVGRLCLAIQPDAACEESLLPRIERLRPTGSTSEVQFRTPQAVWGTARSHISHVVLDSSWEATAAFALEQHRAVVAYAKNDRLDFEIEYPWQDAVHRYRPDFLIRLQAPDGEWNLVLETKGFEREQDRQKRTAADRWVEAVNNHGGHGRWAYRVARGAHDAARVLDEFLAAPRARA